MPKLTPSDVHVDSLLTELSVAFIQEESAFVADKVFPVIPVRKQSNYYLVYDSADWKRVKAKKRAPGSESAGGGFGVTASNTYFCDVWAFHQDIDDQVRANADSPFDLDRDAVQYVTRQVLLAREQAWVSSFFTTGVWGNDTDPANAWNSANGDPIGDIRTGIRTIESATGIRPNTMVVTPDVYDCLADHADVLDRVKYTQRGTLTADLLASIFGLSRVLVARAVVDATAEGVTPSPDYIATEQALICYSEPNPGLMKPSAGYTFAWQGLTGTATPGIRILRFRMDALQSDRIEAEGAWGMEVVASDLGYLFYDVLS